jgi:hypothetical protein
MSTARILGGQITFGCNILGHILRVMAFVASFGVLLVVYVYAKRGFLGSGADRAYFELFARRAKSPGKHQLEAETYTSGAAKPEYYPSQDDHYQSQYGGDYWRRQGNPEQPTGRAFVDPPLSEPISPPPGGGGRHRPFFNGPDAGEAFFDQVFDHLGKIFPGMFQRGRTRRQNCRTPGQSSANQVRQILERTVAVALKSVVAGETYVLECFGPDGRHLGDVTILEAELNNFPEIRAFILRNYFYRGEIDYTELNNITKFVLSYFLFEGGIKLGASTREVFLHHSAMAEAGAEKVIDCTRCSDLKKVTFDSFDGFGEFNPQLSGEFPSHRQILLPSGVNVTVVLTGVWSDALYLDALRKYFHSLPNVVLQDDAITGTYAPPQQPSELTLEDACKILGISVEDSKNSTRLGKVFKAMAKKTHPDKNPSKDTTAEFQRINEANEFIKKVNRRRQAGRG